MRTTFSSENDGFLDSRTDSAQISEELTTPKMRFPKIIRHQKAEVTIYGKKKNYPFFTASSTALMANGGCSISPSSFSA